MTSNFCSCCLYLQISYFKNAYSRYIKRDRQETELGSTSRAVSTLLNVPELFFLVWDLLISIYWILWPWPFAYSNFLLSQFSEASVYWGRLNDEIRKGVMKFSVVMLRTTSLQSPRLELRTQSQWSPERKSHTYMCHWLLSQRLPRQGQRSPALYVDGWRQASRQWL